MVQVVEVSIPKEEEDREKPDTSQASKTGQEVPTTVDHGQIARDSSFGADHQGLRPETQKVLAADGPSIQSTVNAQPANDGRFRPDRKAFVVVGDVFVEPQSSPDTTPHGASGASEPNGQLVREAQKNLREAPPTSVFDSRIGMRDRLYSLVARLKEKIASLVARERESAHSDSNAIGSEDGGMAVEAERAQLSQAESAQLTEAS